MVPYSFWRGTRPWLRVFLAAIYCTLSWFYLMRIFRQPESCLALLLPGVLIPFVLGGLLSSCVHGLMHRPEFPLWPGARQRLLRLTLLELGITLSLCLVLSRLVSHEAPLVAVAGLFLAASALPFANPRTRPIPFFPFTPLLAIGIPLIFGGVFLYPKFLTQVFTASSWLTLLVGAGMAVLTLGLGFDRRRVRARRGVVFHSILTFVDHNQGRLQKSLEDYGREAQLSRIRGENSDTIAGDAPVADVHPRPAFLSSPMEIYGVMSRAQFDNGSKLLNTPLRRIHFILGVILVAFVPVVVVLLVSTHTSLGEFADLLLQLSGAPVKFMDFPHHEAWWIAMFACLSSIPMSVMGSLRLRTRMPIALAVPRAVQARCVFRASLYHTLILAALPFLCTLVLGLCALWRGVPFGQWMIGIPLTISLLAFATAPLLASLSFTRNNLVWIFSQGGISGGSVALFSSLGSDLPRLLRPSLTSVCVVLAVGLVSLLVFRHVVKRRYLDGDLTDELRGPGVAFGAR